MKYLRLAFLLMTVNINLIASEVRERLNGPFIVCSESHFVHAACFFTNHKKSYEDSCPICRDTSLVKVDDALFKLDRSEEDVCSVCLEDFAYNPMTNMSNFQQLKS